MASDVKFHECFGPEIFHEIFLKYLKKFMMANTALSIALRANKVRNSGYLNVTDRQTDRLTTYDSITALCTECIVR